MHADKHGRLIFDGVNISQAAVNRYFGKEIPGWSELGLEKNGVYYMLRDPLELARSTWTWDGLPITVGHGRKSSEVVGLLGDATRFKSPRLLNSAVVWDSSAIDGLRNKTLQQISGSYDYHPDMTPGTWRDQPYDGVMRDIHGVYAALVPASRANAPLQGGTGHAL